MSYIYIKHKAWLNKAYLSLISTDMACYDLTFGAGSISHYLLKLGVPSLYSCDIDPQSRYNAHTLSLKYPGRIQFSICNFAKYIYNNEPSQFILDLGCNDSQIQERMTMKSEQPLNLSMSNSHCIKTYEVVNKYSISALTKVLNVYGGNDNTAYYVAKTIINNRPIKTNLELTNTITRYTHLYRKKPYTKIFYAIRNFVNDELNNLLHGLINLFTRSQTVKGIVLTYNRHEIDTIFDALRIANKMLEGQGWRIKKIKAEGNYHKKFNSGQIWYLCRYDK